MDIFFQVITLFLGLGGITMLVINYLRKFYKQNNTTDNSTTRTLPFYLKKELEKEKEKIKHETQADHVNRFNDAIRDYKKSQPDSDDDGGRG